MIFANLIIKTSALSSVPIFDPQGEVNVTLGDYNASSYNETTRSNCPCAVSSFTCTPNCCCDPLCSAFVNSDSNCIPEPSTSLVKMCDEYDMQTVGSVSNWLQRTIFCVYRQNNPLQSRGIIFSDPLSEEIDVSTSLANIYSSTVATLTLPTVTNATAKPSKSKRGYLFGNQLLASESQQANITIGDVNESLYFGKNVDMIILTDSTPTPTMSNISYSPYYHTDPIQAPTFNVTFPTQSANSKIFVSYNIQIFYREYGYKRYPQNLVTNVGFNYSTSTLNIGGIPNYNSTYIVNLKVSYILLPNDMNTFVTESTSSEDMWVPFKVPGINN